MKTKAISAFALGGFLSIVSAFAAGPSVKAFDPDNDGTIDLAEAQAAGTKLFATLDPDKDGTLDAKEAGARLDVVASDPDKDGTVDAKEFAAAIEARFKSTDPDNDGTVDDKELASKEGIALLQLMQ